MIYRITLEEISQYRLISIKNTKSFIFRRSVRGLPLFDI